MRSKNFDVGILIEMKCSAVIGHCEFITHAVYRRHWHCEVQAYETTSYEARDHCLASLHARISAFFKLLTIISK